MKSNPPNLGLYSPVQPSGNIFGVSNGNNLMEGLSPSSNNLGSFSVQPLSLGLPHSTKTPENFFGVSSANSLTLDLLAPKTHTLSDFLHSEAPNPNSSIPNLTADLVADLTHLNKVKTALDIGKSLHEVSKATQETNKDKLETIVCETAKVAVETAFNTVGTGAIVGGIPLFVAESVAFPPLALATPLVVEALPKAYANVEELSKFAGKKAEEDCYLLFSDKKPK